MRWPRTLVLVLALAAPAAAVTFAELPRAAAQTRPAQAAEPGAPARPTRAGKSPGKPAGGGKRAKVLEKIRAMRAARLAEVLALDTATAARMFAVLDRYDALVLPLKAQIGQARRELKQMIHSGTFDDARANALIDQIQASRAQIAKLEDQRNLEFRKVLTPRQVAVLMVTLPEIDHFIERQIRRAAAGKWGEGDGGQPDDQP